LEKLGTGKIKKPPKKKERREREGRERRTHDTEEEVNVDGG